MSRSLKAHLSLVAMTLIWGATFVVIKNALYDISPLLFNAIRMSCAAVILAVAFHKQLRGIKLGAMRSGALAGFFLYLGNELQTTGLKTVPAVSIVMCCPAARKPSVNSTTEGSIIGSPPVTTICRAPKPSAFARTSSSDASAPSGFQDA